MVSWGLCLVGVLLLPFEWFHLPYVALVNGLHQLIIITVNFSFLFTGLYVWSLGFQPAKYFVLAWFFGDTGIIVAMLGLLNVLPIDNFWGLSLMADRIYA